MKVTITVALDASGKHSVLYIGGNTDEALKAFDNPPAGTTQAAIFRNAQPYKRRKFEASPLALSEAKPSKKK